jgi:acyl carrier protein
MEPIEEMLRKYIADNILFSNNGYPFADSDSFFVKGIVDSTNILELVMFVEEEFGITIEDNEIIQDNFDSVSKLSRFTRSKMDSMVGGIN